MNLTTKYFFANFLTSGLIYGLFLFISDWVFNNDPNPTSTLIQAICFGFFMAVFFSVMTTMNLKEIGIHPINKENLDKFKRRAFSSSLSIEQINSRLNESPLLKKYKPELKDDYLSLRSTSRLLDRLKEIELHHIDSIDNKNNYELRIPEKDAHYLSFYPKLHKNYNLITKIINS